MCNQWKHEKAASSSPLIYCLANRKFNLPLLKHDVRIGIQVRHVDLLAVFKHLWMFSHAKPADVREPEASVIKKCFYVVWYEK